MRPAQKEIQTMSSVIPRNDRIPLAARSIAIAALFVATALAGPATTRAEDNSAATAPVMQASPPEAEQEAPVETVEQRITRLHEELMITADEEEKWADVTKAMKENAAAMERLIAERDSHAGAKMTAVEDLKAYEKFTQTHATALSNLISSFESLYNSMPEPQKAVADDVFDKFGKMGAPPHN
jgi:hypothetical protein